MMSNITLGAKPTHGDSDITLKRQLPPINTEDLELGTISHGPQTPVLNCCSVVHQSHSHFQVSTTTSQQNNVLNCGGTSLQRSGDKNRSRTCSGHQSIMNSSKGSHSEKRINKERATENCDKRINGVTENGNGRINCAIQHGNKRISGGPENGNRRINENSSSNRTHLSVLNERERRKPIQAIVVENVVDGNTNRIKTSNGNNNMGVNGRKHKLPIQSDRVLQEPDSSRRATEREPLMPGKI